MMHPVPPTPLVPPVAMPPTPPVDWAPPVCEATPPVAPPPAAWNPPIEAPPVAALVGVPPLGVPSVPCCESPHPAAPSRGTRRRRLVVVGVMLRMMPTKRAADHAPTRRPTRL